MNINNFYFRLNQNIRNLEFKVELLKNSVRMIKIVKEGIKIIQFKYLIFLINCNLILKVNIYKYKFEFEKKIILKRKMT